jgi:hypothetical protein
MMRLAYRLKIVGIGEQGPVSLMRSLVMHHGRGLTDAQLLEAQLAQGLAIKLLAPKSPPDRQLVPDPPGLCAGAPLLIGVTGSLCGRLLGLGAKCRRANGHNKSKEPGHAGLSVLKGSGIRISWDRLPLDHEPTLGAARPGGLDHTITWRQRERLTCARSGQTASTASIGNSVAVDRPNRDTRTATRSCGRIPAMVPRNPANGPSSTRTGSSFRNGGG